MIPLQKMLEHIYDKQAGSMIRIDIFLGID